MYCCEWCRHVCSFLWSPVSVAVVDVRFVGLLGSDSVMSVSCCYGGGCVAFWYHGSLLVPSPDIG
jgi:hypothetical protein